MFIELRKWKKKPIHLYFLAVIGLSMNVAAKDEIEIEGLPVQMAWGDVDGQGHLDLIALMIQSQTEGVVDTYFENGRLRGVYEDETFKEKFLHTWTHQDGAWREAVKVPLGREPVLGFAIEAGRLMLWYGKGLTIYTWENKQWRVNKQIPTPGLLAHLPVSMDAFPFWQRSGAQSFWLVPDLEGVHLIEVSQPDARRFLAYPETARQRMSREGQKHIIEIAMPEFLDVNGDGDEELVFKGQSYATSWSIVRNESPMTAKAPGVLIDIDGDGLADRLELEEPDVDRPRDLPKVKTGVRTYFATAPLTFPEEPDLDQQVPGFLLTGGDDVDMEFPDPFIDINGDGRPDAAGLAIKFNLFQAIKAVATKRMSMKFLLQLSLQTERGRYETLAGGPFVMTWRINLRRLRMPAFAQMTADFDGDGWIDVLMEKRRNIEITPVNRQGFQNHRVWKVKIPKSVSDPDQVFGKDLKLDGKAELILMKIQRGKTRLAILEAKP